MGYVVKMPQLGMTMEEGVVLEWTQPPGETFESEDVIALVESEKTTNEIQAREAGVILETFVDLDQPIEPGTPIAYVGEPGETIPDDVHQDTPPTDSTTVQGDDDTSGDDQEPPPSADTGSGDSVTITPRARSYAASADIPLEAVSSIDGSGPDGAITEADVIDAAEAGVTTQATPEDPHHAGGGRNISERRELNNFRSVIADRMHRSATEIPQVTLNRRVDITPVLDLKDEFATEQDLEYSLNDFILAAVAETLDRHPEFNAIYDDDVHQLADNINIAVAVDSDKGLITPVLKNVDQLSVHEVAAQRGELLQKVQENTHTQADLSDGTITVTNLGSFGIETFDPLINPPHVAILGIGKLTMDHSHDDDRYLLPVSLTFDHRPLDGADAARFLETFSDVLGDPTTFLAADAAEDAATTFQVDQINGDQSSRRTAVARSEHGMTAEIQSGQFRWHADEPEDLGGTDTAPNPVQQFLGSLTACLALMYRHIAQRRDVPVESVTVEAAGTPEAGRIETIDIDVRVVSDADRDDLRNLLDTAERSCYVSQLISTDIDRSLSLDVDPA